MLKKIVLLSSLLISSVHIYADANLDQLFDEQAEIVLNKSEQENADSVLISTAKTVGNGIKETAKSSIALAAGIILGYETKINCYYAHANMPYIAPALNLLAALIVAKYGSEIFEENFGTQQANIFKVSSAAAFLVFESMANPEKIENVLKKQKK